MTSAEELLAKAMMNGLNKIEKALDTKPDHICLDCGSDVVCGKELCDECDEGE